MGMTAIAEAIEAYLRSRPQAADSVEGIARWWLTGELLNAPYEEVEAVVLELCRRNVLQAETQWSGAVIYRAARSAYDSRESD